MLGLLRLKPHFCRRSDPYRVRAVRSGAKCVMVSSKGKPSSSSSSLRSAPGLVAVGEDCALDSDEIWIQLRGERFTKSSLVGRILTVFYYLTLGIQGAKGWSPRTSVETPG